MGRRQRTGKRAPPPLLAAELPATQDFVDSSGCPISPFPRRLHAIQPTIVANSNRKDEDAVEQKDASFGDMYTEIKELSNYLARYLVRRIPRRKACHFTEQFANLYLMRVVESNWDKTDPDKDSERRRVIIQGARNKQSRDYNDDEKMIASAASSIGLDPVEVFAVLPDNVELYCNPGRVTWQAIGGGTATVWSGDANEDDAYRTLPAVAYQRDQDGVMVGNNQSNMGAAARPFQPGKLGSAPNSKEKMCDLPGNYVVPLELKPLREVVVDMEHCFKPDLKVFCYTEASLLFAVEHFSQTRFGSQRQRPDLESMRRLQQQSAAFRPALSPRNTTSYPSRPPPLMMPSSSAYMNHPPPLSAPTFTFGHHHHQHGTIGSTPHSPALNGPPNAAAAAFNANNSATNYHYHHHHHQQQQQQQQQQLVPQPPSTPPPVGSAFPFPPPRSLLSPLVHPPPPMSPIVNNFQHHHPISQSTPVMSPIGNRAGSGGGSGDNRNDVTELCTALMLSLTDEQRRTVIVNLLKNQEEKKQQPPPPPPPPHNGEGQGSSGSGGWSPFDHPF